MTAGERAAAVVGKLVDDIAASDWPYQVYRTSDGRTVGGYDPTAAFRRAFPDIDPWGDYQAGVARLSAGPTWMVYQAYGGPEMRVFQLDGNGL